MNRHVGPILLLALLPWLANLPLSTGICLSNPALTLSGLGVDVHGAWFPGTAGFFDPTIGWISQPLGMLSAQDWLHGIVPWWNPFTGAGMPLAAEMQTLAFFLPFVLLLKFWGGWLWLKITLQMLSGILMYALLIELNCRRIAALAAGIFYAMNATFFLAPHAVGPIPFLPLILLGIERAARAANAKQPLGWGFIPLGLAYSIYAGYPEIAYLNGLLAAAWTLARFAALESRRWAFAGKITLGVGFELAMSMPLIVPFMQYVGLSYLGLHKSVYATQVQGHWAALLQIFPFIFGPFEISTLQMPFHRPYHPSGWISLPALVLALAALIRPGKRQVLIATLIGFIVIWQARIWGFPPAIFLINLLPYVARTDSVRFIAPSLEAAIFILADLGLDGWLRTGAPTGLRRKRPLASLALAVGAVLTAALVASTPVLLGWLRANPGFLLYVTLTTLWEVACGILCFVLLAFPPGRVGTSLMLGLVAVSASLWAALPELSAARTGHLDLAGVAYLQRHIGLARLYTMGPFGPDYPAAFGIAAIDDNQLPVAENWRAYVQSRLDPYADISNFVGHWPRDVHLASQSTELQKNLGAYAATGVKYVMTLPGVNPFRDILALVPASSPIVRALALLPNHQFSGKFLSSLLNFGHIGRSIGEVDIFIGTYQGAASGILTIKLCAAHVCASGSISLDHAGDNKYLPITLDRPLAVPEGTQVTYTISHGAGSPVALWLAPALAGAPGAFTLPHETALFAPLLRFVAPLLADAPSLVFHDQVMNIYRLPRYRSFFTTSPDCILAVQDWNGLDADCRRPAILTRLEAAYPGWHARVNHSAVPIGTQDALFQIINLPSGQSHVYFVYMPLHTRTLCAIAILAFVVWAGLLIGARYIKPCHYNAM